MSDKEKLEKIIEHYGRNAQIIKAMEEFGELITELAKELNGQGSIEHISEEMADAWVMLKQLQLIYDIDGEDLMAICKSKIVRTMNRVKAAELFESGFKRRIIMRLIRTKPGGIYVNAAHIIDISTTGDMTISITLSDSTELYAQDYQTKEACEFAFNDLIRRLTEDHKLIELMTEEQAREEIERRRQK